MALGFLLAIMAALTSATAAILQSIGARRIALTSHLDPRMFWRLIRCGPYAIGLVLDGATSGLAFTALRTVPLFAVQAVGAANLTLIALLSTIVLRVRLRPRDWAAVGAVVVGLLLLALSARPGPPAAGAREDGWALLGVVLVLAVGAYLVSPRTPAALAGLLAGLSFGAAATGARLIGAVGSLSGALASPATYALLVAGPIGVLLYAAALQRGSVTVASAMTILGQTVAPATAGWLLLGDDVRSGAAPLAVLGFLLAITGAVALAHHAQPNPGASG